MRFCIDDNKFALAFANSGLTFEGVAQRAGMSRQRLSAILNSKRVTAQAVGKVAHALGVDVSEIIVTESK